MTLTLKELGEQLRQARDGKGLSLKEAAQITKIGPRILEAFEQGDRDRFPHPVYAKGFVKNYAKLLGVDPAECGRAMAQALETPRQTAEPEQGVKAPLAYPASVAAAPQGKDKRSSLPMILALVVMVGLLVVLVWYLFLAPGASSSEEQDGQEPMAAAHQETGAQDAQGQSISGQSIPGQNPSGTPLGQAGEQAVVEAGADLGDVAPQDVPALPPGSHRLEIRAQDEQGSWIGVYALEPDPATGQSVLLKDYTVAGTGQLTLTLTEPHNYRFGRIQGVAVFFDGEPVDTPGEGTRNLVFPPRQ